MDRKLRSEGYKLPPLGSELSVAERIIEVTDADPATSSAKLPIILSVMVREAHNIGREVPNEYVSAMEGVSELEGFAAVVYSSNFEFEAGLEASISPNSAGTGGRNEAGVGEKSLEELSATEAEEAVKVENGAGIMDRATGLADTATGGFESVWGRVTGRGEDTLTG